MNQTPNFAFLPQCDIVDNLLKACVGLLATSPESAPRDHLIDALRLFEVYVAATMWGLDDVDQCKSLGLSADEKREAVGRFVESYMCADADWTALDLHARRVAAERQAGVLSQEVEAAKA